MYLSSPLQIYGDAMTESYPLLFTCFTSVCSLFAVVKAYEEHTRNRTTFVHTRRTRYPRR